MFLSYTISAYGFSRFAVKQFANPEWQQQGQLYKIMIIWTTNNSDARKFCNLIECAFFERPFIAVHAELDR